MYIIWFIFFKYWFFKYQLDPSNNVLVCPTTFKHRTERWNCNSFIIFFQFIFYLVRGCFAEFWQVLPRTTKATKLKMPIIAPTKTGFTSSVIYTIFSIFFFFLWNRKWQLKPQRLINSKLGFFFLENYKHFEQVKESTNM